MLQAENRNGAHGEVLDQQEKQVSRAGFLKLAAAGALGAGALSLGLPQFTFAADAAPAFPSFKPGLYVIQSQLNGYVLDVRGGSTAPGTEVINYPLSNPPAPNQVWNITADGYIISALNGYVLDVKGASTTPGASVISYPRNTTASNNQRWSISSDGYIASILNGQVLDVKGGSTAAGALVITYPRSNSPQSNQKWRLRPITVG